MGGIAVGHSGTAGDAVECRAPDLPLATAVLAVVGGDAKVGIYRLGVIGQAGVKAKFGCWVLTSRRHVAVVDGQEIVGVDVALVAIVAHCELQALPGRKVVDTNDVRDGLPFSVVGVVGVEAAGDPTTATVCGLPVAEIVVITSATTDVAHSLSNSLVTATNAEQKRGEEGDANSRNSAGDKRQPAANRGKRDGTTSESGPIIVALPPATPTAPIPH